MLLVDEWIRIDEKYESLLRGERESLPRRRARHLRKIFEDSTIGTAEEEEEEKGEEE